ncbi:MAG: thymidine phosphorylase [Pyrinomonadaceae bacterium MAG19_C2-C3]|nr:thymidine phosphorylase [Pyrinomonadaceae bacterium MAG19_C2-C3]
MQPQDIIRRKRDGEALSKDEIKVFVDGVTSGAFADYQSAALLMAIFQRGMTTDERDALTQAMLHSGTVLDFSDIPKAKVDKHSTGGVGDKTSLIIAPLAAACGLCVPMISGRGLGHTGGTLDKLEAIPGYRVQMSLDEFRRILERVGFAMIGQTGEIAPADKKLYALRDVTATVESIPLISASIMSKKLAEGLDGLVLDVKCGDGAFMKDYERALELANSLVDIGRAANVNTVALVTNMEQPLGHAIGNSLEVIECIEILLGEEKSTSADLRELSLELTAQMLVVGGVTDYIEAAREKVAHALTSGAARDKFGESIEAQGGNANVMRDTNLLPHARATQDLISDSSGYVTRLAAESVGIASMMLGAGRVRVEDTIDPAVGIILHKKIGDKVEHGEPLATLHYNDAHKLDDARRTLRSAFQISENQPPDSATLPLVRAVV